MIMGKAITMNDTVEIKLTLTQAHLLRSVLYTASYDLRKINERESELLDRFERIITKQILSIDDSENEKIARNIRERFAKEANKKK